MKDSTKDISHVEELNAELAKVIEHLTRCEEIADKYSLPFIIPNINNHISKGQVAFIPKGTHTDEVPIGHSEWALEEDKNGYVVNSQWISSANMDC